MTLIFTTIIFTTITFTTITFTITFTIYRVYFTILHSLNEAYRIYISFSEIHNTVILHECLWTELFEVRFNDAVLYHF